MTTTTAPQPYKPDEPIVKVQTIEADGPRRVRFRHDFTRLDASNFDLLLRREKETVRVSEKLGKGRTRPRFDEFRADANFYAALITGGGWRPADVAPIPALDLATPVIADLYDAGRFDEATQLYLPGWRPLTREQMCRFTPERMKNAVDAFLAFKAEYVPEEGDGIEFMFDEGGLMKFRLLVGDPDAPAYRLLIQMRRPESQRRANFRDSFAYGIDHSKGEVGKTETIINYQQGVGFCDEHFATAHDDPEYSPVVLSQKRVGDETTDEAERVVPYSDGLRSTLLSVLNPVAKVELASAVVLQYSQTDRE